MALIFHKMVSIEHARSLAAKSIVKVAGTEEMPVIEARGRVVYTDIFSDMDSPPFDRSEVDGYAVISGDIEDAEQDHPLALHVSGMSPIGEPAVRLSDRGTCVKIATGSVVPIGADAVIMVEYTRQRGNTVDIFRSVKPGENISQAGSDVSKGELLIRGGTVIGPREMSVLMSTGIERIRVYRQVKVAILSTGNELVGSGRKLLPGQIYESNGISIHSILQQYPAFRPVYHGIVRDDRKAIAETIRSLAADNDLVITSGSTSAGEGDMVYDVLSEFSPGIVFHGVEVKPGKPTLLAMMGNVPIIGLPGFPVSAIMVFETIFLPAMLEACGIRRKGRTVAGIIPVRLNLSPGKMNLIPVSLVERKRTVAYPLLGDSGSVSRLMRSDGYVSVYGDRPYIAQGELHNITLFSDDVQIPDLTFIGSHDIALEAIFGRLSVNVKVINVGSTGGIEAIRRGEADIAGVHILDPGSMRYNDFSPDAALMDVADLVKGYRREQGILVKPGNPHGIRSFRDISTSGVAFVNRNTGSGTRILVDRLVSENGIAGTIKGFSYEVKTHYAVANAIWSGRADAGIAIRQAAVMYGLDFIPVNTEEYDFLVLRESAGKLSAFIETLNGEWFRNILKNEFSGYSR